MVRRVGCVHLHEYVGNIVSGPKSLVDRQKKEGIKRMPDILALELLFRDSDAFEERLERQLCCHREEMILWSPKGIRCGRVLV